MVSASEVLDLPSISWALVVRFRLIAEFHRRHPSPGSWDDIDRDYTEKLRADIAVLRDCEHRLHRRAAHHHQEEPQ